MTIFSLKDAAWTEQAKNKNKKEALSMGDLRRTIESQGKENMKEQNA